MATCARYATHFSLRFSKPSFYFPLLESQGRARRTKKKSLYAQKKTSSSTCSIFGTNVPAIFMTSWHTFLALAGRYLCSFNTSLSHLRIMSSYLCSIHSERRTQCHGSCVEASFVFIWEKLFNASKTIPPPSSGSPSLLHQQGADFKPCLEGER